MIIAKKIKPAENLTNEIFYQWKIIDLQYLQISMYLLFAPSLPTSIQLSIYSSIPPLSINPFIHLCMYNICPYLCVSVSLSVRMSVYIPTCTYVCNWLLFILHIKKAFIILLTSSYLTEIAISAVMVISTLAREEDQLTILTFPPRICEVKETTVYGNIIPVGVIGAVLMGMLVIIGWVIYKVNWTLHD